MTAKNVWPDFVGSIRPSGFSDSQLERLSVGTGPSKEVSFRSPWLFITSEIYGHGSSFRQIAGWPNWLPIPVQSDHGIDMSNEMDPRDEDGVSPIYLTWPEWRAGIKSDKRVIRILNPLVAFRRINGIAQMPDARGTLVFIPHTKKVGKPYPAHDWEDYFHRLDGLPDELKPRAICLFHIDIRNGLHHVLRQFGLPILTAGAPSNPDYGHRFYDLISRFEFATSSFIGSQLWYCEELGVKYFLFGEPPQKVATPDEVWNKLRKPWNANQLRRYQRLYSEIPPRPSAEKSRELESALFISQTVEQLRQLLRRLFLKQLISILPATIQRSAVSLSSPGGRKKLKAKLKRGSGAGLGDTLT